MPQSHGQERLKVKTAGVTPTVDKIQSTSRLQNVSGDRMGQEALQVNSVLVTPSKYLQSNEMTSGRHREDEV
ncbi:MAG: hypothetical protein K8J08_15195, partial [Thermoanaerobaculia bacterium]|nr:hypothetical protein [Thermoanaerobaculia bacterium]